MSAACALHCTLQSPWPAIFSTLASVPTPSPGLHTVGAQVLCEEACIGAGLNQRAHSPTPAAMAPPPKPWLHPQEPWPHPQQSWPQPAGAIAHWLDIRVCQATAEPTQSLPLKGTGLGRKTEVAMWAGVTWPRSEAWLSREAGARPLCSVSSLGSRDPNCAHSQERIKDIRPGAGPGTARTSLLQTSQSQEASAPP